MCACNVHRGLNSYPHYGPRFLIYSYGILCRGLRLWGAVSGLRKSLIIEKEIGSTMGHEMKTGSIRGFM